MPVMYMPESPVRATHCFHGFPACPKVYTARLIEYVFLAVVPKCREQLHGLRRQCHHWLQNITSEELENRCVSES